MEVCLSKSSDVGVTNAMPDMRLVQTFADRYLSRSNSILGGNLFSILSLLGLVTPKLYRNIVLLT